MLAAERTTLASLYAATLYEVDFADGTLAFGVGLNPCTAPPFVIVTAYNPGLERPSPTQNEAANNRLEQRLNSEGRRFVTATGRAVDASHEEPSFAIFDITVVDAISIARDFGQAAVFVWDGTTGAIAWCDESP